MIGHSIHGVNANCIQNMWMSVSSYVWMGGNRSKHKERGFYHEEDGDVFYHLYFSAGIFKTGVNVHRVRIVMIFVGRNWEVERYIVWYI